MLEGLWLAVELTVWFDGLRSTLQNAVEKVEPAVGDHRISVSCKPRGVRVRAWAYEWRNRDSTDRSVVDRFLSYALYALGHAPSRTLPLPRFVPMVGLCPFVPRTPNPDHKGTNTIGREVREEIGWENGRRMNGNNSWMKGRSWSCSTVHSSVLFHPIGGAVAWAVVGVCGHERLKGKKNCWREGWSRPPLQAFVLFTHAWWLTRTSPRQQIIYFPFNQKKFPGHA